MAQKITLNELKRLVKKIIKENDEYSYSEDEKKMFDDAIKSFERGGRVNVQYDGATEYDFRPDSNYTDAIKVTVSFISRDAAAIITYKLIINTFLNSPTSEALRKIKNLYLGGPYLAIKDVQLYSESKSKKINLNKSGVFPDGDERYSWLETLDQMTGSVLIKSLQKEIKEYWENHHNDDSYDY